MSACKIFLYMGIIWGRRMKRRFIMKIALKDGSVKEYAGEMSVIDIAKDISEGLARMA